MTKWTDLATDIEEFEDWSKRVGDYHAQAALYRFLRYKRMEHMKIQAADKTKFIEETEE